MDDVSTYHILQNGSTLLNGQYIIEGVLGQGGFGITYLARASGLERQVAIKECFPTSLCTRSKANVMPLSRTTNNDFSSAVDRFLREARRLSSLNHSSIVRVDQVFQENNTAYMVLEYLDGETLEGILEDTKISPPEQELTSLTHKLLDALEQVHGVDMLHRDISPDNIIMQSEGRPVLIDFGAARESASDTNRKKSSMAVVKDGYSPSEFYVKGSKQGPASDLYALAATLYRVITGEPPEESPVRSHARAAGEPDPYKPLVDGDTEYSPRFLSLLDDAMAFQFNKRPKNVAAWRVRLAKVAAGENTGKKKKAKTKPPVIANPGPEPIVQAEPKTDIPETIRDQAAQDQTAPDDAAETIAAPPVSTPIETSRPVSKDAPISTPLEAGETPANSGEDGSNTKRKLVPVLLSIGLLGAIGFGGYAYTQTNWLDSLKPATVADTPAPLEAADKPDSGEGAAPESKEEDAPEPQRLEKPDTPPAETKQPEKERPEPAPVQKVETPKPAQPQESPAERRQREKLQGSTNNSGPAAEPDTNGTDAARDAIRRKIQERRGIVPEASAPIGASHSQPAGGQTVQGNIQQRLDAAERQRLADEKADQEKAEEERRRREQNNQSQSSPDGSTRAIDDNRNLSDFESAPVIVQRPAPQPAYVAPPVQRKTAAPVIVKPRLIESAAPIYPRRAEERGTEGEVEVSYRIDTSGTPIHIEVLGGKNSHIFKSAAIKALTNTSYRPKTIDGVTAISSVQKKTYTFELKD